MPSNSSSVSNAGVITKLVTPGMRHGLHLTNPRRAIESGDYLRGADRARSGGKKTAAFQESTFREFLEIVSRIGLGRR